MTADEFVIMPNHFHGIIFIHDDSDEPEHLRSHGTYLYFPDGYRNRFGPQSNNLTSIVRGLKSAVAKRMRISGVENMIWQERYYERIIRNQDELEKFRQYIRNNPYTREDDEENPFNIRKAG